MHDPLHPDLYLDVHRARAQELRDEVARCRLVAPAGRGRWAAGWWRRSVAVAAPVSGLTPAPEPVTVVDLTDAPEPVTVVDLTPAPEPVTVVDLTGAPEPVTVVDPAVLPAQAGPTSEALAPG